MELFYKSKYFSLEELTYTDEPLNNQPKTFGEVVNLLALQFFLDSLREKLGKPIIVNSAFRSPDVNIVVDGATNSHHLEGLAADIRVSDMSSSDLTIFIRQHYSTNCFAELLKYGTFVHVAIKRSYWLPFVCNRFTSDLKFGKL